MSQSSRFLDRMFLKLFSTQLTIADLTAFYFRILACHRAWGYDQILLQVESDNKVARSFYRKLGFEELLTDMSEKRYDTSGLYLTMIPAPKVLLRKVIN
jgi:GNAT superfamily N-acetyltransferase